jgi:hypothetical protein
MRNFLPAALLLALAASPAAADGTMHQRTAAGVHTPHLPSLRELERLRHLDISRRFARTPFSPFFPAQFAELGFLPWGDELAPAGEVPVAVVPAALPPRPPVSLADERPRVETTSDGVTIVRGPGSHHIAR